MADAFERIEKDGVKRCIISLPSWHTKSKFAKVLFPAWFLGKHLRDKILEASHIASLAMDFGWELRNARASFTEPWPPGSIWP
jgi:hypothetical protein